ncbi:Alpha/Beta hydrolase protein [Helicostylum pulchrum]|nr:Alpha/Beta hydrolase protein [Helicostylum pulchrum]
MPEYYLQVDNTNLCYKVDGTGPFIVIVPGGNGGSRLFKGFRDLLVKHFTVVLYDRRGYFRSNLTDTQDYSKRLETDVGDLHRIMENVTQEKFIIFGISSSGVIVMTYLNKYPENLSKIIVHEPMLYIDTFEGRDELQKFHLETYNTYRTKGKNAAMEEFGNKHFNELDYKFVARKQKDGIVNNWDYWFQYEWREYPFAKIDWKTVKSH